MKDKVDIIVVETFEKDYGTGFMFYLPPFLNDMPRGDLSTMVRFKFIGDKRTVEMLNNEIHKKDESRLNSYSIGKYNYDLLYRLMKVYMERLKEIKGNNEENEVFNIIKNHILNVVLYTITEGNKVYRPFKNVNINAVKVFNDIESRRTNKKFDGFGINVSGSNKNNRLIHELDIIPNDTYMFLDIRVSSRSENNYDTINFIKHNILGVRDDQLNLNVLKYADSIFSFDKIDGNVLNVLGTNGRETFKDIVNRLSKTRINYTHSGYILKGLGFITNDIGSPKRKTYYVFKVIHKYVEKNIISSTLDRTLSIDENTGDVDDISKYLDVDDNGEVIVKYVPESVNTITIVNNPSKIRIISSNDIKNGIHLPYLMFEKFGDSRLNVRTVNNISVHFKYDDGYIMGKVNVDENNILFFKPNSVQVYHMQQLPGFVDFIRKTIDGSIIEFNKKLSRYDSTRKMRQEVEYMDFKGELKVKGKYYEITT